MPTLLARVRSLLTREIMNERARGQAEQEKMLIGDSVKFAVFLVTRDGVGPDPDKTKAISHFPTPIDLTQLGSFLGLANQLTVFLPGFVQNTTRMRQLLKKTTAWLWTEEIDAEFRKVKELLTSDALFKPFGAPYQASDGRQGAPRARLRPHPVSRSKSLTPTQQRYSTVEIEVMAVKWAIEDNDCYLRGIRLCTVLTDHRPLVGLFAKHLQEITSPWLRRFCEALMPYNLKIEWVQGKTHFIARKTLIRPIPVSTCAWRLIQPFR